MATCTVTYSPEVARRAARTYFWRKFKTLFGALYLASVPLMIGAIAFIYHMQGANWFVGAFGLLLFFNLLMEWTYYFSLPRALARRLADPANRTAEVTTSADGVRIAIGPNASLLKWARFKHVWLYDDFVILAVMPPLMTGFVYLPTAGMTPEVRRDLESASQGKAII
jgi:hypothetical protein